MRYGRLIFWLLLVPTVLLIFAWRMNTHLAEVRTGALEERERAEQEAKLLAENARQTALYVEARLDERRARAARCVDRALQTIGDDLADGPALVVFGFRGCGEDCDTDATLSALVNEYWLQKLRVLLIRTEPSSLPVVPAGVDMVVISECRPLVERYGDDYAFRDARGRLSSSGERHEQILQFGGKAPPPFEPEVLVRRGLDLPPKAVR